MNIQAVQKIKDIGITNVEETKGQFIVRGRTSTQAGSCPGCGASRGRVHSYYWRSIDDLPMQANRVRLSVRFKRWRCVNKSCSRRTFAEQLPELVGRHQQRTARLNRLAQGLGLELGGEQSRRALACLGLVLSGQTLLQLIRQSQGESPRQARWIGIDDWCWRRGVRYGTVIVDLESHGPIDLLPDREADTLVRWLEQQPQIGGCEPRSG